MAGRSITVTHSEFFASGLSYNAFHVEPYPLNPGLFSTFPWLSGIASRYEQYHFRSLEVVYHTRQPSIARGTLAFMFDFDVLDNPPSTLVQALQTQDHTAQSVWKDIRLRIPIRNDRSTYYVRSAFPSTTSYDERLYDYGKLYVISEGCSDGVDGAVMGQIELIYTVDLINPQIEDTISGRVVSDFPSTVNTFMTGGTSPGPGSATVAEHSRLPFQMLGSNRLLFRDAFEGVFAFIVHNANMGFGGTPEAQIVGPATCHTKTFDVQNSESDLGDLVYDVSWKVAIQAVAGAVLTVQLVMNNVWPGTGTVEWAKWNFFSASYDQFDSSIGRELPRRERGGAKGESSSTAPRREGSSTGKEKERK